MKIIQLFLVSLASVLCSADCTAADKPAKLIIVAGYSQEDTDSSGPRAHSILREHQIFSIAAGSRGYSISVPSEKATKAQQLLAQAIQSEGLNLTLLKLDHGFYEVVSAESILKTKPNADARFHFQEAVFWSSAVGLT